MVVAVIITSILDAKDLWSPAVDIVAAMNLQVMVHGSGSNNNSSRNCYNSSTGIVTIVLMVTVVVAIVINFKCSSLFFLPLASLSKWGERDSSSPLNLFLIQWRLISS